MHEVRHIIVRKDDIIHLLAQIQCRHQQHGHRDAAGKAGQGRQHDEHKDDARRPQQGRAGEQKALQYARDEGREQDALQKRQTAVLLLHRRADHQQQEHIVDKVIPAAVPQHMAEEPKIEQRVFQRGAVDAEQMGGGPAAGVPAQKQCPQREEEKCQDDRRIVLDCQREFRSFRVCFLLSQRAVRAASCVMKQ